MRPVLVEQLAPCSMLANVRTGGIWNHLWTHGTSELASSGTATDRYQFAHGSCIPAERRPAASQSVISTYHRKVHASRSGPDVCAAGQDAPPHSGCLEFDRAASDYSYLELASWICCQ